MKTRAHEAKTPTGIDIFHNVWNVPPAAVCVGFSFSFRSNNLIYAAIQIHIIVGKGRMTLYDMPSVFEKVGLTDALRPYGITDVVAMDSVGAYLMGCEPADVEYPVRAKDKPFILTTQ